MKRILPLALPALLALGTCGTAAAQSNITLYGLIDSSMTWVDNGAAGSSVKQQSGVAAGTRWGVLGSENLGGGIKANFVLEAGFFNDTGVSTGLGGFSRRSVVGLSGAWGALDVGRDYNPVHTLLAQQDPMANGMLSAASGFMGNAGAQQPNAVFYTTPDMAGWGGKIGYSLGENVNGARNGDTLSSRLVYDKDGLIAGMAYAYQNVVQTGGGSFIRDRQLLLTASYRFAFITPVVMFETGKNKSGSIVYNSNNGVPFSADYHTMMLGASVPVGVHRLAVSYQRYDDRTRANADAANLALAGFYNLSKRTTLYANVAKLNNKNGQQFAFVDAGKNVYSYTANGAHINPLGVAAGIMHRF